MSTWKIGKAGEQIVSEYLGNSGWLVYPAPEKRHPLDWVLATPDKTTIALADAKTKPARLKYDDTGINLSHYEEYRYLQDKYKLEMMLFFVDTENLAIYTGELSTMTRQVAVNGKKYPSIEPTLHNQQIIYFPLVAMKKVSSLTEEQAREINELSKRNYTYPGQARDIITYMQPALIDVPYKPKISRRRLKTDDDPTFLNQMLLIRTCQCGQDKLNPQLHDCYCEYKAILLAR